jgi:peroxiredoxin
MKYRYVIAALVFLLCGAALGGAGRILTEGGGYAANPGASTGPAADFSLPDLDGRQVTLGKFFGKTPVLLVFWATWCPECKAAIPEINALTTGPLAEKLQVFGLDFRESREQVALAVKSRGIRYPVLLDERGQAARAYGVVGIPTYILIDRRGNVAYREHVLPGKEIARLLAS